MRNPRLLLLPVLVASLAALPPSSLGAADQSTIRIGAILAVTGPNANLGTPEARTLQMLADQANAAGGISGRKVQIIVKDSQGSAEKAVSFAKQLIEEEDVLAIIGPSTTGESMKLKGLCDDSEVILLSCAAGETIVNPVARWVFKVAPMDRFAAQMIFSTMKKMGISRIGALCSNSGFGQGGKAQLLKLAPEAGITVAIAEDYDKDATDLTGVLTKIRGQDVQAVVNWSTEPAQSIVLKNIRQMGFDVPVFQSHGFGNLAYAAAAGKAAEGTLFPCGRILVADALPASNPQKAVLTAYKAAYVKRYAEEPSTFGGHAWDSFTLLADAVRHVGTDRGKVRDYLESVKGFVGTAGIFNFSASDHNGLSMDAFEMLTVKDGRFVPLK
ncbi:MAG TPA: ABC transporter substrate-binding protein [Spirochaetia bacterium]|nr:ABC transporter substrate-binding protein [Spirochaetia bacterium]